MKTRLRIALFPRLPLVALMLVGACRPHRALPDGGDAKNGTASASSSATLVTKKDEPVISSRCLWPPPGTVVRTRRPVLRVSSGAYVELCRTRACEAPLRIAVGEGGRATPAADLSTGAWFWRVVSTDASSPGPLWRFVVQSGKGLASRVHGVDLNGDGLADIPLDAAVLFGAENGHFAPAFTPVPYAELDSPPAGSAPAPIRPLMVRLINPVGDVDGDGVDDAILGKRVLLGGPSGIKPPATWLACPASGCGDPAGDIDGDGFADLFTKDALLFGSPGGFRVTPSTLLSGAEHVRRASDVDGDGVNDLVALSADRRTLSVFRGSTRGPTLGSKAVVDLPVDPTADVDLVVADVDGDGASDIVLLAVERETGKRQRLRITVTARLTGRGGEIANAKELRASWTADAPGGAEDASANVSVADVDGDGRDDLVVFVSTLHAGHARLIHADASALRLDPRSIAFGTRDGAWVSALVSAGDVDGDGRDDVVLVGNDDTGLVQMIDLFAGTKSGLAPKPSARFVFSASDRVPQSRE